MNIFLIWNWSLGIRWDGCYYTNLSALEQPPYLLEAISVLAVEFAILIVLGNFNQSPLNALIWLTTVVTLQTWFYFRTMEISSGIGVYYHQSPATVRALSFSFKVLCSYSLPQRRKECLIVLLPDSVGFHRDLGIFPLNLGLGTTKSEGAAIAYDWIVSMLTSSVHRYKAAAWFSEELLEMKWQKRHPEHQ